MKKLYALTGLTLTFATLYINSYSQVSTAFNFGGGGNYVGWDNTMVGIPLDIKHELNQPIHLHTFTGAGGFGNIRMTILGNYTGTGGLIGIGDMGSTAIPYTPNYLLDSYRIGNTDVFHQFINDNTGITNLDGFRIGIRYDNGPNYSIAELRNFENSPMIFYTNNTQRLRITTDDNLFPAPVTRVVILESPGVMLLPLALLHLGAPWTQNAGGHRLWMDVGTYSTIGSDNAYFGLKTESTNGFPGSDHMDAVINWGDNIQGPEGADHLRVIFTSGQIAAFGHAGSVDGLEVMRFTGFIIEK